MKLWLRRAYCETKFIRRWSKLVLANIGLDDTGVELVSQISGGGPGSNNHVMILSILGSFSRKLGQRGDSATTGMEPWRLWDRAGSSPVVSNAVHRLCMWVKSTSPPIGTSSRGVFPSTPPTRRCFSIRYCSLLMQAPRCSVCLVLLGSDSRGETTSDELTTVRTPWSPSSTTSKYPDWRYYQQPTRERERERDRERWQLLWPRRKTWNPFRLDDTQPVGDMTEKQRCGKVFAPERRMKHAPVTVSNSVPTPTNTRVRND